MSSVTARISQVKQPRGGYLPVSLFKEEKFSDGLELEEENLSPALIGTAVDYLSRFMSGTKLEDAFAISLSGYLIRTKLLKKKNLRPDKKNKIDSTFLLKNIKGLDDNSILMALRLCSYDVWFRDPMAGLFFSKSALEINPDKKTLSNIRIMVERSLSFFKKYGPVISDGFTFEKDGYSKTVDCGDGDFLTKDTLWDFKVLKTKPNSKHTLQILMYYIMGKHSKKPEFKDIKNIGIFNPRLNAVYLLCTEDISDDIIKTVENDIICY